MINKGDIISVSTGLAPETMLDLGIYRANQDITQEQLNELTEGYKEQDEDKFWQWVTENTKLFTECEYRELWIDNELNISIETP